MFKVKEDFLRSYSRKRLNEYIRNLSNLLKNEKYERNIKIYTKWLEDALNEARRRDKALEAYLDLITKILK